MFIRLHVFTGLILSAAASIFAYTLPPVPPVITVAPKSMNSMPMGNPAAFSEVKMDFAMETNGPFLPTWSSISANVPGNGTPAWLRQAKFGIWVHYGPQANLASGDWSAQHMYQQGASAYAFHTNYFGHPTTNGYKDVIRAWAPTNYSPGGLAQLFYNAGARFVLVQGAHHDNFDNWNSRYNPWNEMNFGPKRDTMAEWATALRDLGMRFGVAFHHEYSWWFTQPDFLSDNSGPLAGIPYDAVTATNSAGTWWQNYDVRRLYNQDLHKYQGITVPHIGYWNPNQGIFTNDLDYCHWYATQWALRMLDVIERYDPDFIYTDGNSTQPFSGYATGTGYKCDAMQRVIAHYYNRTLERRGQLDTLAIVKFHNGDHIGTTFEGGYASSIKENQPWLAEYIEPGADWYWAPGVTYDNGGTFIHRLLEAVSRGGGLVASIPPRPDGALDSGATNMLIGVGQWMSIHGEGIYGSKAWVIPSDGNFRFTVGANGSLYAYYEGIPSGGTKLTIPALATAAKLLAGAIGTVSLLGSSNSLAWSQTATGLVVTLPVAMPILPSGTAIGFKIGPASAVGTAQPTNLIAYSGSNHIDLTWYSSSSSAVFRVKRATTQGGPYTTISSHLTKGAFRDSTVSPGTLYFYVVSAVDAAGESANTAEAAASSSAWPSTKWLTEDVGTVGATGRVAWSGSTVTVEGSGADIWYDTDEFRYMFQALSGDCTITARVLGMQNTAGWAKAGLMIRETLDPAAQYVINFLSPVNGAALQQRSGAGNGATGVSNNLGRGAPYWLRLIRSGNTVTSYVSPDGANWTQTGTTTVAMSASAYVGVAVCSVKHGTLCQAQFDNLSVSSSALVVNSPTNPSLNAVRPGRPPRNGAPGLNGARDKFLFVTFKQEVTPMCEQIYFNLSPDGRHWHALNGSEPVLVSTVGEMGVRDSYLIHSHDGKKFYLIATDLHANVYPDWHRATHAGSRSIAIWDSADLVHWSPARLVKVAPDDAGCAWAPEAVYDEAKQAYLVFWASTTASDSFNKLRIWAAWTKDFTTFGKPFLYIDKPWHVIDTDIVRENGIYYRFSKDDEYKSITVETCTNLLGPWKDANDFSLAKIRGYEGPECFCLKPAADGKPGTWCLLLDRYSEQAGYQTFVTEDLGSGQFKPGEDFVFPFKFRHGCVLPISAEEYEDLEEAYGKGKPLRN